MNQPPLLNKAPMIPEDEEKFPDLEKSKQPQPLLRVGQYLDGDDPLQPQTAENLTHRTTKKKGHQQPNSQNILWGRESICHCRTHCSGKVLYFSVPAIPAIPGRHPSVRPGFSDL